MSEPADRPRIYVTRQIDPQALKRLREKAYVTVWPEAGPPPAETLAKELETADGLLSMLNDNLDADVISKAPYLKAISQMAVGYDNIDTRASTERGIPVGHTPGVLTETTADFTWALLMALARRVAESDRSVRAGSWPAWGPDVFTGPDIHSATLGIVGLGRIGQAVARRACGFNMRVLACAPRPDPALADQLNLQFVDLDSLLAEADFVSLHVYLSAETRGMIGERELAKMKPTAMLINTARGPVVDVQALTQALQAGRIAGAVLDVFDPEPIPAGHPLLSMDNVIITPHIASASRQTRTQMAEMAVDNLLAALDQRRMPHCANLEVYDKNS